MRLLFFIVFFQFASSILYSQVDAEWRGVGRTGVFDAEQHLLKEWPADGPDLLWVNDSIPRGYASVSVANNFIYTTGVEDAMEVVCAFDLTGKLKWKKAYGRKWDSSYDGSRSTPTVEKDYLYVCSGFGDVACLNALTGDIVWQSKVNDVFDGEKGRFGISESLLIVDNKILCTPGGNQTTMVALNKLNGNLIWKSKSLKDTPSYASPLLINHNGKKIVLQFTVNYFFGLNPNTGDILWTYEFGKEKPETARNNQTNTPIYHNGEIFITSGYNHHSVMLGLAEEGNSVDVKWVDSVLDVHHGGVVLVDGYIYGSNWIHNRMGNWTCLNWDTGVASYSTEWFNKGAIVSADNMLYCYDEKGGNIALVPVNPEKFEVKSHFKVPYGKGPHWGHLVIKDGILYVRHENALMAFDIKMK